MTQTADVGTLVSQWLSPSGQDDPYQVFRSLHEHGPVLRVSDDLTLIVGYAEAESVLRDHRFAVEDSSYIDGVAPGWREHTSRVVFDRSMLCVNGPAHERMRRLVDRAFVARRVDGLRAGVERRMVGLVTRLSEFQGPLDFIEDFAYLLPVNVICDILGIPDADRSRFRRPVSDLAMALDPGWIYADLGAADAAAAELTAYFEELLAQRRLQPGNDLLSDMLQMNKVTDEPVSQDELVANAVLLLLAGFETSIGMLGNGLMVLLERPELGARLRQHPELAPAFVAEVLRYDSPVQLTGRRAATDLELGGVGIATGSSVILALGAANRDPGRFSSPDDFQLGRTATSALSFGSGRHFCLGARLARLEGEIAFALLPKALPNMRLVGNPARLGRTNLRVFETLRVSLEIRGGAPSFPNGASTCPEGVPNDRCPVSSSRGDWADVSPKVSTSPSAPR